MGMYLVMAQELDPLLSVLNPRIIDCNICLSYLCPCYCWYWVYYCYCCWFRYLCL
nr:hypothetical protein Q903MT_gene759 [Picea sitchensis]